MELDCARQRELVDLKVVRQAHIQGTFCYDEDSDAEVSDDDEDTKVKDATKTKPL